MLSFVDGRSSMLFDSTGESAGRLHCAKMGDEKARQPRQARRERARRIGLFRMKDNLTSFRQLSGDRCHTYLEPEKLGSYLRFSLSSRRVDPPSLHSDGKLLPLNTL